MKTAIMVKPNCIYCIHEKVCGVYLTLWLATIEMDKFYCLAEDYEEKLSQVLAEQCSKFDEP